MTTDLRQALLAIVGGDLRALHVLETPSRVSVEQVAGDLDLVLTAAALAGVIAEYDTGVRTRDEVQRWAAFVRWGDLPGVSGPRLSDVRVDYEAPAEDAIIEALARLDELGDLIDGELRPGEATQLRAALVGAASRG